MGETMTKAQKAFMADLADAQGCRVECYPEEWRTARSLAKRGLIKIVSEQNPTGFFEVMLSELADG
jgi:hypothetical protein